MSLQSIQQVFVERQLSQTGLPSDTRNIVSNKKKIFTQVDDREATDNVKIFTLDVVSAKADSDAGHREKEGGWGQFLVHLWP